MPSASLVTLCAAAAALGSFIPRTRLTAQNWLTDPPELRAVRELAGEVRAAELRLSPNDPTRQALVREMAQRQATLRARRADALRRWRDVDGELAAVRRREPETGATAQALRTTEAEAKRTYCSLDPAAKVCARGPTS